jgi:formylglycine-generating enzyme required for sulfatase activity
MAGDAWEWTEDLYHHSYDGAPADGAAWGDDEGSSKVIRGGYWRPGPVDARAAYRNHFDGHYHFGILSFRPVR